MEVCAEHRIYISFLYHSCWTSAHIDWSKALHGNTTSDGYLEVFSRFANANNELRVRIWDFAGKLTKLLVTRRSLMSSIWWKPLGCIKWGGPCTAAKGEEDDDSSLSWQENTTGVMRIAAWVRSRGASWPMRSRRDGLPEPYASSDALNQSLAYARPQRVTDFCVDIMSDPSANEHLRSRVMCYDFSTSRGGI